MKILLIDDNMEITNAFTSLIQAKGHECTISNDGNDGLKQIKEQKWDVILLDLAMPVITGRDVIKELDKNQLLKTNNIIIFTASNINDEEIENYLKMGIKKCIRKPATINEIFDALDSLS